MSTNNHLPYISWHDMDSLQYDLKVKLADDTDGYSIILTTNGDINTVAQKKGNFSKSLPHANGIVNQTEFNKLINAIYSNNYKHITNVQLGTPNGLKLVDPSNVFDFETIAKYKGTYAFPPAPKMASAESAGEMVELYEMKNCRDIPFINWTSDSTITSATTNIDSLSDFRGPKIGGHVTTQTLFRGFTSGDIIGPYLSQFFLYPINAGYYSFDQKYPSTPVGDKYITTIDQFTNLWNGNVTQTQTADGPSRYITTMRDGARLVHYDEPGQIFVNAYRILRSIGAPLNSGIPYHNGTIPNQSEFVSQGITDILDLILRSVKLGLDAAWYVKWTQLRLRPEEFGYRLHLHKTGQDTNVIIHTDILNNPVLSQVFAENGTYLLPQMYAEGSPTHPSYPAGHSAAAGAGATILKAFYNNDFAFPVSYIASADGSSLVTTGDTLTVSNELDKLASNVAIFRNVAGVHYRSDALGINLGEQVAISLLKQYIQRYKQPTKFSFKMFDGNTIEIKNYD